MATTEHFYTGNGSTTTFAFTFPYLANNDVKVEVDNVLKTENSSGLTNNDYSISSTNIVFNSAPASATIVHIYRNTDVDTAQAVYAAGSSIRAVDLNNNQTQVLYSTQEAQTQLIRTSDIKDGAVTSVKIADGTIATVDLANNAVTTAKIANDAITTAKVAADAITGAKIADNAINHEHLQNDSVRTSEIKDGNVTTAKIAADAITNAKIADNAIATEHIEASGVRTANIQNSAVTTDKIAATAVNESKIGTGAVTTAKIDNNAVTSAKIANNSINHDHLQADSVRTQEIKDGNVTTAKLPNNAVTTAKIANDAITSTQIADNSINSEHYVDGSIDTAHIADSQVTTAKLNDNAVTTQKIAANAIGANQIANNAINHDHLQADSVRTQEIKDDVVTTAKLASTAVTDAKLASNSVTTSKITDANVTTVKIADSNVTLAKLAGDLKRTTITNSDAQIPTSGAVVDYVTAQLAPIGGLEVIATDAAFPNTMPAAGVVISIADAGGLVVNGSGTSTTGRTVNGSTVTINNINSAFNSTTVDPGVSFMVSSTGGNQIYNFHKATLKEADILSLSGDINDFAERYRVSADPDNLPNKDEGDLVYDTNADVMKVYDSTTSSWKEVASTGDFEYLFLTGVGTSGAPTINGSIAQYDLRVGSNTGPAATVISAAQLLVSINGVVQKANSGTSAPSEGFAMVDANTIIFGSALQTGDSVFIVQIGSSINIPTPGDNTVTAAKIASGAVTTAKIADDAVTGAKVASGAVTTAKIADDAVTGAKIAANLDIPDNNKIRFGTGNDLEIYHDPTYGHSFIKESGSGGLIFGASVYEFYNPAINEKMITAFQNGRVELYYDNSKKFETTSGGITVTGDLVPEANDTRALGTGSLQWAQSNIRELKVYEKSIHYDNVKALFGHGEDLQIYHDGSHSYIDNDTGRLYIRNSSTDLILIQALEGENSIIAYPNGQIKLLYDDSTKFETASYGVNVTGTLKVNGTAISTGGLGNVVEDTTPQLGGDLDFNGNNALLQGAGQNINTNWDNDAWEKIVFDASYNANAQGPNKIVLHNDTSWKAGFGVAAGELGVYSGSNIAFYTNSTDSTASTKEGLANFKHNGAVDLYYDGVKKFETQANGVEITGNLFLDDTTTGNNGRIKLGTGEDLQIYHDGANGYIRNSGTGVLRFRSGSVRAYNGGGDELLFRGTENGNFEAYYDNSKKLETNANGARITGSLWADGLYMDDNEKIHLGTSGTDIQIYHDGSNSYFANGTGATLITGSGAGNIAIKPNSSEDSIVAVPNGNVQLYYDGSKKLNTESWGVNIVGEINCSSHINLGDSDRLNLGGGQDLKLYHNGSNSIINNNTGDLSIQSDGNLKLERKDGGEDYIHCAQDGQVELHYNGSVTAETTSWGFAVGGSPNGTAVGGLSNYSLYAGFGLNSSSTFGGIVMGSGVNGNSPFVAASKAGNGTALHLRLTTNGSTRMLIQDNGNIGAPSGTNIYNASDSRLKKNVTTLDKGLETIKSLRPVSFNWIDGFCDVEKDPLYGFIAQEVETVDSNLVSPFGDDVELGKDQVITDPLRVNEKFIIPMLVKAVQELSAKVAALEAK